MSNAPINMILFCPRCGKQHIDAPDAPDMVSVHSSGRESHWDNPPHRSHLCAGCGCVWRPADVPTNGVARIETRGERDVALPREEGSVRAHSICLCPDCTKMPERPPVFVTQYLTLTSDGPVLTRRAIRDWPTWAEPLTKGWGKPPAPLGWVLLRKRDGRHRGFSRNEPDQKQLRYAALDGDEWIRVGPI